jgi:hypothetical protein
MGWVSEPDSREGPPVVDTGKGERVAQPGANAAARNKLANALMASLVSCECPWGGGAGIFDTVQSCIASGGNGQDGIVLLISWSSSVNAQGRG